MNFVRGFTDNFKPSPSNFKKLSIPPRWTDGQKNRHPDRRTELRTISYIKCLPMTDLHFGLMIPLQQREENNPQKQSQTMSFRLTLVADERRILLPPPALCGQHCYHPGQTRPDQPTPRTETEGRTDGQG